MKMRALHLLFVLTFLTILNLALIQGKDVVCSGRTKKRTVIVDIGDSFSFKTQADGRNRTSCNVQYKKSPSCSLLRFSCSSCTKKGDRLRVFVDRKRKKFCQRNLRNITSSKDLKVVFRSKRRKQRKQYSGPECQVQCQEATVRDGNWGSWESWSTCTKSCGKGMQSRSRSCNNPAPSNGGKVCPGSSTARQSCNDKCCPIDAKWNSWSLFSSCSKSCGLGTKKRKRSCSLGSCGGKIQCFGSDDETETCNTQNCPIDGEWGSWESWSPCNKSCGNGWQSRSRSCNNPAPSNGGKVCPGSSTARQRCCNCDDFFDTCR